MHESNVEHDFLMTNNNQKSIFIIATKYSNCGRKWVFLQEVKIKKITVIII